MSAFVLNSFIKEYSFMLFLISDLLKVNSNCIPYTCSSPRAWQWGILCLNSVLQCLYSCAQVSVKKAASLLYSVFCSTRTWVITVMAVLFENPHDSVCLFTLLSTCLLIYCFSPCPPPSGSAGIEKKEVVRETSQVH